jgi:serine/threonine-protein kinase haspin
VSRRCVGIAVETSLSSRTRDRNGPELIDLIAWLCSSRGSTRDGSDQVRVEVRSLPTIIDLALSDPVVVLLLVTLLVMLGTRTKQVFSYGRRGHRIVSISDDHENDIASNNKDKPADPWRTPVVVKTKMRHHFPSESPSPQFVRVQNRASKKKRPSPLSPAASLKKKRTRLRQIVKGNASAKSKTDATPTRRPLSCYYPNVPGSPAVRTKKNARVAGAKGTPLGNKLSKPFSPFMDMDIIVLDNDGRRISQERRVSRTDVVVNPPVREAAGGQARKGILKKRQESQIIVLSDSDDEQAAPKPPKRAGGRPKAIILSSDESEADELIATPFKPKTKSTAQPAPKANPAQRLQVEVVISPIKRAVKPKPKYRSPTPELPPTPLATKYVPIPIPQPRARQLTPIRRGGSKALFRTYSPTPTTSTDLDTSLDFDFGDLTLSPSHAIQSIPPPEYLLPLLDECGQKTPHEFSAFIETFPFDPVVQPVDEDLDSPNDVQFRKIGEASYSEVFGIGNVVLKVIPLRDDTSASAPAPISDIETPFPSEAKDVLKEIIVTRAMGAVCEGFVRLLKTYIVRGKYPEVLLTLWDEYDNRKGSEGVRPGMSCLPL